MKKKNIFIILISILFFLLLLLFYILHFKMNMVSAASNFSYDDYGLYLNEIKSDDINDVEPVIQVPFFEDENISEESVSNDLIIEDIIIPINNDISDFDDIKEEKYEKITSKRYEINNTDCNYIIGMRNNITIEDFLKDIDNDTSELKIYDSSDNLITDYTLKIKTGYILKLFKDDILNDSLVLVVRGDINGDGLINVSDVMLVKYYVNGKEDISGYRFYAADVNIDGCINDDDATLISDYKLNKIKDLNFM